MSEIQVLTDRVQRLGESVDLWNSVMVWGLFFAALAAAWVGVATRLIVVKTAQQAKAEELLGAAKERQLQADLKAKDVQIVNLKFRSDTAEAEIANAQASAARALTEQQQVQIELARQQQKAADAEKSLLTLQERIKPRRLTDKDAAAFAAALKALPMGTVDFGYTAAGGDETFNFAKQFLPLFAQAGWVVRNKASIANHLDIQVIGVDILLSVPSDTDPHAPPPTRFPLTPTLKTMQDAFQAVGIQVRYVRFPGKDVPEVVIGSKPESVR
ncbi:hypothetical protein WS94_20405 [Burkholderia territorii]|nr:hypothetical protein WS94_20405 [Burkholderia territorii]